MQRRRLGKSAIVVSDICMGTMTFGSQTGEAEAIRILDQCFDAGIDFYDTAEGYPVPPDPKWVGRTEEIVGKWLKTKPRDAIVLATKVSGPSHVWFRSPKREGMTALDRRNIPGCTYCHPQIASVGTTEAKAKEAGHAVKVGAFPFIGNGKAIALGESDGFVKTVFDAKTGELLGAHMIGAEVTELIQGYVVGKTLETTEVELMNTVFPHPTLSEMMHEATLAAYGRALHI